MMTSPDFWAILRVLAGSAESAALVFDILEKGSRGNPPAIMADNYEAAVSLLDHFASAANPHAALGQITDAAQRKGERPTKDVKA